MNVGAMLAEHGLASPAQLAALELFRDVPAAGCDRAYERLARGLADEEFAAIADVAAGLAPAWLRRHLAGAPDLPGADASERRHQLAGLDRIARKPRRKPTSAR